MSAPSFTPVILKQQIRVDGSCAVKMRITHNRKSKYLPTSVVVSKSEYTKEGKLKSSVLVRMSDLLKKIGAIVESKTTFEWDIMDLDDVCNYIAMRLTPEEEFRLDFFEWSETFMSKRKAGSVVNYRTALSAFKKFVGSNRLDIAQVTSSLMRRFESYLVEMYGNDARAVSLYTSSIAAIHTEARKTFNDNELGKVNIRNPFDFYTPPKQKPAMKRTVEFETIQKLINIREHLSHYHKLAVDTYLLSFVTMGTNIPDLYEATRKDNIIYYNRAKTRDRRFDKAEMQIRLEPVASVVISALIDEDNERAFNFHKHYKQYKSIADKANDRLADVAKVIGVKPFTMYSARHTWASLAYSLGIPKSLINDCLCHVDPDMAVTDIYIKKDWSVLWEANRKVLESFDWSKF